MNSRRDALLSSTGKKKGFFILCFILVAAIGVGAVYVIKGSKQQTNDQAQSEIVTEEYAKTLESQVNMSGSIETNDGKNLSIWMAPMRSNNFGIIPWTQGETFTLTVESVREQELEIGIMSVSTDEIYSETIESGTGSVDIVIPEDGDYRVFIQNNELNKAEFLLKLSKAIEGPIT
ncbi:hypothetical protein [Paenibacillus paridis]|uniref:hypothetical protein n=1 Tax=Paenibacillus paridis TaxID=2583376 RepID=UPI00111D1E6B|nr:hypothetical protein [Paenibacillus paridis]